MKYPFLFIHGEEDKNTGTDPMQSQMYFKAIQSKGIPSRLVLLAKEGHNYQAKESIFHLLWEQERWLDKYVKNK